MLNVVGLQIENQFDRDENLDRATEWIHKIEGNPDLILLPELFTSGYSKEVFQNLDKVAEDKTSDSFEVFSLLARQHKTYISFGFPEKVITDRPNYFISQAVLDRKGELVGTYRKINLAQFGKDAVEKDYFTPGWMPFTFEIDGVKIGIATCYDFRFPEFIRKLTVASGINFLIHPSVFKQDHTFHSWYDFAATRAIENQIYLMSLNYAGKEYGYSVFFKPNDTRPGAMSSEEEGLLYGEVDLEVQEKIREIYPLLKDRKLEF